MRELSWEWTEDDLLEMKTNEAQESLVLEFKASMALMKRDHEKNETSKDVSAFANSAGGDILYGVKELGEAPSRFGDIDDGIDASDVAPEWLEQVINSRVQPRINGIRINPISLERTRPGRFVYVIHIPASRDAPHQASDNKYYKRFNFQSVAMEEYEIRDVRNRWVEPVVTVEVSGRNRTPSQLWNEQGFAQVDLSIVLKNIGRRIARQVYVECDIPNRYIAGVWSINGRPELILIDRDKHRQLRYHHRDASGSLPLFPGTDHEVLDGNRLSVHMRLQQGEAYDSLAKFISWVVYADGAEPRSGEISIGELFRPW